MKLKIFFSHPTGNANVRAVLKGFLDAGILEKFYTTIATFSGNIFDRLSGIGVLSEFKRRKYDDGLRTVTALTPLRELCRLFAVRMKLSGLVKHEKGLFSTDSVYRSLDRLVAKKVRHIRGIDNAAVYAYEDGALESFRLAKKSGLQCIYDLPTGYWRAKNMILENEKERFQDWRSTITALADSELKLKRKDEEVMLADCIFVASRFTASTLNEFPGPVPPVEIIPYGFPDVEEGREYAVISSTTPLRLLFVGSLSQQKGLADLFEVVDVLDKKVSLTVIGRKANDNCMALNRQLEKHRWIPSMSHQDILSEMREHDVLVFPTLFDGFGLVITEAMSQGTPVIATYNCAGPDLIEHERNGWLMNAGSSVELKAIIEKLRENPLLIAEAGKAAMETARKRPWSVYSKEMASAVMRHSSVGV